MLMIEIDREGRTESSESHEVFRVREVGLYHRFIIPILRLRQKLQLSQGQSVDHTCLEDVCVEG
jgi:hypothetical protein